MSLRPGTELTLHYLNWEAELARRSNIQVSGQGLGAQDTPGGMLVTLNPAAEWRENCLRMEYLGSPTLLPNSLVHYEHQMNYPNPGATCDLMDYAGRAMIGIVQEGAKTTGCPWVQYQGIGRVLYDRTTFPFGDALYRERIGSKGGSPYAQYDRSGPLMVMQVLDDAGLPANVGIAQVIFLQRFSTPVYSLQDPLDGPTEGVHCVWIFGPSFSVQQTGLIGEITATMMS